MTKKSNDVEAIYNAAVKKKAGPERSAYLDNACGDDNALRARVETLLRAQEQVGDYLEVPAVDPNMTIDGLTQIEGPGTKIGRYELLELIGEGGMGLVYMARQKKPVKRKVALKIIKPGMDSRQVIARFEAERQALAVLDHPNIASVFDAGTTKEGRPYFIMEYVKGLSIIQYCDEHKINIEKRLRLFEQVCEGIHHAHQKGIIHRDLKPSNILVSVHGDRVVPKIIDFGIAKAVTQPLTEKTFVTFQGQLLGTLEYMSPEQVDMATQDIDTRSDIYSLGVVLYELLAGVLPFERESFASLGFADIQRTIREKEPASPSNRLTKLGEQAKTIAASRDTHVVALARRLYRELEWIPLKAMRKERCRRYKSASEMADDIRNYLNGNPLTAGPETAVYRARKFVHKHAGSVTTVALVTIAVLLGLVASVIFGCRAEQARQEEVLARKQVEQALVRAENAEKATKKKAEELRRTLYVNSIQLADAKYREGNVRNARKLLASCPEDLRGWEWDRINHVLDQSLIAFDTHKWNLLSLSLNQDGKRLVTGGPDRTLKVWDITTGKELTTLSEAHTGSIYPVAFSPDGKYIASGDSSGEIKIWDAADVNEAVTSIHSPGLNSVSFSPDSKRVVSASRVTKVWDAATGVEIVAFSGHKTGVRCAVFSPNGKDIVSADGAGIIKIWNSVSGDEAMSLAGHDNTIESVSINSDGSLFASGSFDNTIKIWNARTGSLAMTLYGHDGPVTSVVFSPDDRYVASSSWDSTVRIWDIATGQELRILRGHGGIVTSVIFTPDGRQAVSAGKDGIVKVWDVNIDREVNRFLGHGSSIASIAFNPNGKRLVSLSKGGEVKVWDVASCSEVMTFSGGIEGALLSSVAFSPDGKRIASVGAECAVKVWDAETGAEVTTLDNSEDQVRFFAFSPDGKRIASSSYKGKLKLWDVKQGKEIMTFREAGPWASSVAFSPDGRRLASGGTDITVWDVASGDELMRLVAEGDRRYIYHVVFSPDGKRIAAAGGQARIWDAATGKELKTIRGHGDRVISVAFSPDSKRLVTGSPDGTAKLWDSTTGDELLTLRAGSAVAGVAFSPDGKTIVGGTQGNTIMLWNSTADVLNSTDSVSR